MDILPKLNLFDNRNLFAKYEGLDSLYNEVRLTDLGSSKIARLLSKAFYSLKSNKMEKKIIETKKKNEKLKYDLSIEIEFDDEIILSINYHNFSFCFFIKYTEKPFLDTIHFIDCKFYIDNKIKGDIQLHTYEHNRYIKSDWDFVKMIFSSMNALFIHNNYPILLKEFIEDKKPPKFKERKLKRKKVNSYFFQNTLNPYERVK